MFGERLFYQTVGISMGTNSAPVPSWRFLIRIEERSLTNFWKKRK